MIGDCADQIRHLARDLNGISRPDDLPSKAESLADLLKRASDIMSGQLDGMEVRIEAPDEPKITCSAMLVLQLLTAIRLP